MHSTRARRSRAGSRDAEGVVFVDEELKTAPPRRSEHPGLIPPLARTPGPPPAATLGLKPRTARQKKGPRLSLTLPAERHSSTDCCRKQLRQSRRLHHSTALFCGRRPPLSTSFEGAPSPSPLEATMARGAPAGWPAQAPPFHPFIHPRASQMTTLGGKRKPVFHHSLSTP